jgi:hypothetical protein
MPSRADLGLPRSAASGKAACPETRSSIVRGLTRPALFKEVRSGDSASVHHR